MSTFLLVIAIITALHIICHVSFICTVHFRIYCTVCTYFLYDVHRRRWAAVLPALLLRVRDRAVRYSEGSLREGHVSAVISQLPVRALLRLSHMLSI